MGGSPIPLLLLPLLLLLRIVHASYYQYDYCQLGYNHTMCAYRDISPYCGENSYGGFITEEEKKTILDTHNRLRAIIANGQEAQGAPGPQPPSKDMQLLQWDDELAAIAQRWADQCVFEHDALRNSPRFSVGQNLFQSEGGVPWEEAIQSWYSEVEFFDRNLVDNFIADPATGHFTQLAWGNTRYIGCGKRIYPQNRRRFRRDAPSHPPPPPPPPPSDPMALREDLLLLGAEADDANVRQTRRIGGSAYNKNAANQFGSKGHSAAYYQNKPQQNINRNYNWDDHFYRYRTTTAATTTTTTTTTTPSPVDDAWAAYNRSLHEYAEKYKDLLQNSEEHRRQLKLYREYIDQARQLERGQARAGEDRQSSFNSLVDKQRELTRIYDRQLYYDRKLKHRLATKKHLNPAVSKHYSFTPEKPVVAGVEFEYYVCNYGPSGNFPGSRMYTRGRSECPYYGLCLDPLTTEYYPSVEIENDPILRVLYSSRRK